LSDGKLVHSRIVQIRTLPFNPYQKENYMKRVLTALVACLLFSVPAMAQEKGHGPKAGGHRGKTVIATKDAPPAIGPYSQAIQAGPLLFVSGSLGMDVAGKIVPGGVAAEAEQALNNLGAILKAAGASFDSVVKTTIFLTEMADFSTVNEIYAKRFSGAPPARSTVAVKELPRGGKVEIEVTAIVSRKAKPE
jgi:2-iminobutanoate/2-iminopropanoate deaminase